MKKVKYNLFFSLIGLSEHMNTIAKELLTYTDDEIKSHGKELLKATNTIKCLAKEMGEKLENQRRETKQNE